MNKHLGKMHVVRAPCGHVVASCWVDGNELDAKLFKRRHQRELRIVETLDRYSEDPMPEWCHRGCDRLPQQEQPQ